jgi:hypothetical protein
MIKRWSGFLVTTFLLTNLPDPCPGQVCPLLTVSDAKTCWHLHTQLCTLCMARQSFLFVSNLHMSQVILSRTEIETAHWSSLPLPSQKLSFYSLTFFCGGWVKLCYLFRSFCPCCLCYSILLTSPLVPMLHSLPLCCDCLPSPWLLHPSIIIPFLMYVCLVSTAGLVRCGSWGSEWDR